MRHPEFPLVSFFCIPLLLCSLPSHIRAGSISTIALISWLVVMSIIRGVNSLVWADNVVVRLEVWCDITTKITIGFTYAVPAAALCILRHLEAVASTRHARTTLEDKRWRQKFEAAMCFGIPIIFMALHYIVQGHRFDLIEDIGCSPAQYISVAAIFILWIPPLFLSIITMIYAILSLRHFLRHRISFSTHLRSSQSAISPARYFRLMALAVVEMAWDAGTNIYLLYFNITVSGLRPWISWENVHSNFSRIAVFPTFVLPPEFLKQFIWQWWIIPVSCLLFFIFFGFGEEAMADYRTAIDWIGWNVLSRHKSPGFAMKPSLVSYRSGFVLPLSPGLDSQESWKTPHGLPSPLSGFDQPIFRPPAAILLDRQSNGSCDPLTDPNASWPLSQADFTRVSCPATTSEDSHEREVSTPYPPDRPLSASLHKHNSLSFTPQVIETRESKTQS